MAVATSSAVRQNLIFLPYALLSSAPFPRVSPVFHSNSFSPSTHPMTGWCLHLALLPCVLCLLHEVANRGRGGSSTQNSGRKANETRGASPLPTTFPLIACATSSRERRAAAAPPPPRHCAIALVSPRYVCSLSAPFTPPLEPTAIPTRRSLQIVEPTRAVASRPPGTPQWHTVQQHPGPPHHTQYLSAVASQIRYWRGGD